MTPLEALNALSSIATAVGVGVAATQLLATRRQAGTAFEDSLSSQYRSLTDRLPIEALFGENLPPDEQAALLPQFLRYIDFCNEQAFLHECGRISGSTWQNWKDGICGNMNRPAFATAWAVIAKRAPDDFNALRRLCPLKPSRIKWIALSTSPAR